VLGIDSGRMTGHPEASQSDELLVPIKQMEAAKQSVRCPRGDGVGRPFEAHDKQDAGATLQAAIGGVGPFELDGIDTEGARLPGADVANFAVVVVVPALARNRIGDRFAELVRRGGSERVESGTAAETASAAWIWHHGVEGVVVDGVVIAAENFAGGATALGDRDAGRKENEIERVGGCGGQRAGGDLLLQEFLDGGIVNRFSRSRSCEGDGAGARAVADFQTGGAVFAELVEKLAGENEVKELIDLGEQSILRDFIPGGAPEDGEDLHGSQQRSIAIGELGRNLRSGCFRLTGMQGNDADGVVEL